MTNLMINTHMMRDGYVSVHSSLEDYMNELEVQAEQSQWISGVISKRMSVESLDEGPMFITEADATMRNIPSAALIDTASANGTCLILHTAEGQMAVRDSALSGLYETAKISGSALGRVSTKERADILNICLPVARGRSLLLMRAGKVSAVLSDNAGGYRIMDSLDVLEVAQEKMERLFGNLSFVRGVVKHEYTYGEFVLEDASESILKEYSRIVNANAHIVREPPVCVKMRVSNSDTGYSAARIQPRYGLANGTSFALVEGIAVEHKRSNNPKKADGLEAFKNQIDNLVSKIHESEEYVRKMSGTILDYPHCVLVGLCRKHHIPQKWIKQANDDLSIYVADGQQCTMMDVYYSIAGIPAYAECDKASAQTIMNLEEKVSRISRAETDWKALDINIYIHERY